MILPLLSPVALALPDLVVRVADSVADAFAAGDPLFFASLAALALVCALGLALEGDLSAERLAASLGHAVLGRPDDEAEDEALLDALQSAVWDDEPATPGVPAGAPAHRTGSA